MHFEQTEDCGDFTVSKNPVDFGMSTCAIQKTCAFILADSEKKMIYPTFFADSALVIPPKYVKVSKLSTADEKMLTRYATCISIAAQKNRQTCLAQCVTCNKVCGGHSIFCPRCEFTRYCSVECMTIDEFRHQNDECTGVSASKLIGAKVAWNYSPYYDMCYFSELSGDGFAYQELHASTKVKELAMSKRVGLSILDYTETAHPHVAYVFFRYDKCHKVTIVYPLKLQGATNFAAKFAHKHNDCFRPAGKAHSPFIQRVKEVHDVALGWKDPPGCGSAKHSFLVYKAEHNGYPFSSPAKCDASFSIPAKQAAHNINLFWTKRYQKVAVAVAWKQFKRRVYLTVIFNWVKRFYTKSLKRHAKRSLFRWRQQRETWRRTKTLWEFAHRHCCQRTWAFATKCGRKWFAGHRSRAQQSASLAYRLRLLNIWAFQRLYQKTVLARQDRQNAALVAAVLESKRVTTLQTALDKFRKNQQAGRALHRYVTRRGLGVVDHQRLCFLEQENAHLRYLLEAEQWRSYWALVHIRDWVGMQANDAYPAASTMRMAGNF